MKFGSLLENRFSPNSFTYPLCWLAVLCWTASLFLPALGSSPEKLFRGKDLLAIGWLALLAGNVAWLANLWFLWAVVRVLRQRSASLLALLALGCALDTWRLTRYLVNEGGTTAQVYGYGWGAVLWLLAMTLLLAASGGVPGSSNKGSLTSLRIRWLKPLGLLLSAVVIISTGALSTLQHNSSSKFEQERLRGYAFKRSPVCSVEVAAVQSPLKAFTGPLELDLASTQLYSPYPFIDLEDMLLWGVPIIRSGGRDFRLLSMGKEVLLMSTPAQGDAAATLTIRENKTSLVATLNALDGHQVFSQQWNEQPNGEHCPEFSPFPSSGRQPRKLLTDALGLAPIAREKKAWTAESTQGVVIDHLETSSTFAAVVNEGCPANTGWTANSSTGSMPERNLDAPFQIAERRYYLDRSAGRHALCIGQIAYLYDIHSMHKGLVVQLQRRDLKDFRLIWATYIRIPSNVFGDEGRDVKINSINEQDGDIILSMTQAPAGETMLIKAKVFFAP
ncbi:hypothetical protein [Pseudomonas oryzihabitans]|uniref:hypothetical protein n=1 Tax=Pseudomonas oryzihabitans TaxID=47885 RepID=UPI002855C15F|nr:hypothetical protein [Pseudomonas psychrotolerans]MDR6676599.1 hypothetical protein [Pseudomonas psychrotolerans]